MYISRYFSGHLLQRCLQMLVDNTDSNKTLSTILLRLFSERNQTTRCRLDCPISKSVVFSYAFPPRSRLYRPLVAVDWWFQSTCFSERWLRNPSGRRTRCTFKFPGSSVAIFILFTIKIDKIINELHSSAIVILGSNTIAWYCVSNLYLALGPAKRQSS